MRGHSFEFSRSLAVLAVRLERIENVECKKMRDAFTRFFFSSTDVLINDAKIKTNGESFAADEIWEICVLFTRQRNIFLEALLNIHFRLRMFIRCFFHLFAPLDIYTCKHIPCFRISMLKKKGE